MPGTPNSNPLQPGAMYAYSFEQGPVHFAVVNSELYVDGPQHKQLGWLEKDLMTVNRTLTPWVVLMFHSPHVARAGQSLAGRTYTRARI